MIELDKWGFEIKLLLSHLMVYKMYDIDLQLWRFDTMLCNSYERV